MLLDSLNKTLSGIPILSNSLSLYFVLAVPRGCLTSQPNPPHTSMQPCVEDFKRPRIN